MGESEESLLKAINHYQSGLERYMQRQDESKMLHNLGRLYKLPIKVCHLEKTGVGRTVNSLRKLDGQVGDIAKSLVAKWKEMVVREENKKPESASSEEEREDVPQCREEKQSTSHKNINNDTKDYDHKNTRKLPSEKSQESIKSKNYSDNVSKEHRHEEKHKKKCHSNSEDSNEDRNDSKNSDSETSGKIKFHKRKEEQPHENIKNTPKSKETRNKLKHSSEDEDSEHESHKSKGSKHDKNEMSDKKKHKHKSSHEKKEDKRTNSKSKEEKNQDSPNHDRERKKDHKSKESKSKKEENQEKHKKSKYSEKGDSSKDLHDSSDSKLVASKKEKIGDKRKSSKSDAAVINGIGSGSGTSFADALGMCEPPPMKKKKSLSQPERPKEQSPTYDENELPCELPLPKEPLENLDINISTLLPPITPHYRPLGLPVCDEQPKKSMTDDEALSRVMMNKNQRTKVFSGNKVAWGKVPSLFDICVRILQDNLDALEYTGGVPYSILKPILDKATANQLYMMEHHNPYLIEDSDELWKLHCQKEFRNKSREELETWRDMYMRCLDEREAKLKALTANIKQSQDKSLPVRTTKLAYVDSVAKPPRNIARKQAKNDTTTVRQSPSSKLVALATKGECSKVAVPNPGARAAERSTSGSSHHSVKAKKAPLMAKTLSLFKNRFRR